MRRAAAIAAEGHCRAMRLVRPGRHEHEIEAELLHAFRSAGAVPSYEPIVGGGANACVLHYRANNAPLRDGDLRWSTPAPSCTATPRISRARFP